MPNADVRARHLAFLAARQFRVAESLPIGREAGVGLRPVDEIAGRFCALDAVFTWVASPEEKVPAARLTAYVERNGLVAHMSEAERDIFALERDVAHRAHVGTIGWRLENMWPLAWILGLEMAPGVEDGMIETPTIKAIFAIMPKLDATIASWLEGRTIRSSDEVLALEDLFYCAHNAARSGGACVPKSFDRMVDGGVIHEKRHALTWATSPGVTWDDTDLST